MSYHMVKMAHSIHVEQEFEDYQDSRTVQIAQWPVQKKLNKQIKYICYQISPPVVKSGTLLTELWG